MLMPNEARRRAYFVAFQLSSLHSAQDTSPRERFNSSPSSKVGFLEVFLEEDVAPGSEGMYMLM